MKKYPDKIGLVVNLNLPPSYIGKYSKLPAAISPLMHLADLLILYDTISIRLDFNTIHALYSTFYVDELEILLKNKRIVFVPGINYNSFSGAFLYDNGKYSLENYIKELSRQVGMFFSRGHTQYDNTKKIINQISKYMIIPELSTGNEFEVFREEMKKKFDTAYDTNSMKHFMFAYTGFRQGIGKMIDFFSTKTPSFHIDNEMIYYLNLIAQKNNEKGKVKISNTALIDESLSILHKLHNIPSVMSLIAEGKWTRETFLKVTMSQESNDLREWIKNNFQEDFDLRDIYISTMNNLPAKKTWVNWVRFGSVTTITSAIGLLLTTNPILATIIGIGIGTIDNKFGDKIINKVSGKYNPEQWITYMGKMHKTTMPNIQDLNEI